MSEIVSDSTPLEMRSSTTPRTWSRSTGTSVSPRASIRSTASRVSARDAGGSGLTMMIQPASGPGVWDRARWRIWPNPRVVMSPTRAPLDSRTALVATVVPWTRLPIASGPMPASAQMRRTPASTPCDGSAGVDGVLTRHWRRPPASSTRNRSVKVPPTSTPSRYAIRFLPSGSSRRHGLRAGPLDHTRVPQPRPLLRARAQFLQDLVRVRADRPARRPPDHSRRVAQLRHHAGRGHLAVHVVDVLDEQPALAEERVGGDVRRRVDRRAHDAALVDDPVELLRGVLRRPRADHLVELVLMLTARVVGGEAPVPPGLGPPHQRGEPPPQRVVVGRDDHPPAVLGAVHVRGRDAGDARAARLPHEAGLLVLHDHGLRHREAGVGDGGVDDLSGRAPGVPRVEREQDALERGLRGERVA